MHTTAHEFALFVPALTNQPTLEITDTDLVNRIAHVLRMEPGSYCVLFDVHQALKVQITQITKKAVTATVVSRLPITPITPSITLLLPILKREAFEEALYAMTELGVNKVQPITTAKTQSSWGSEKDYQRAQRIFIAAAEQSKQFALPVLEKVKPLAQVLETHQGSALLFDAAGKPLKEVLNQLSAGPVTCLIGPEGDLTPQEKELVASKGFVPCALTPTVLRAQQAAVLGVGVIRSWFKT
jgi:16S rRNA (uracil1498-N3)-methyltransferase